MDSKHAPAIPFSNICSHWKKKEIHVLAPELKRLWDNSSLWTPPCAYCWCWNWEPHCARGLDHVVLFVTVSSPVFPLPNHFCCSSPHPQKGWPQEVDFKKLRQTKHLTEKMDIWKATTTAECFSLWQLLTEKKHLGFQVVLQ